MERDLGRGSSLSDQFGRLDPFCFVLIVPMLLVGVISLVAGVYIVVTAMVVGAAVVLGFDSWANRPWRLPSQSGGQRTRSRASSRGNDFWDESDHTGAHLQPNQPERRSAPAGQARSGRGPAPERDPRAQAARRSPQSWQQRGAPERHPHQPAERSWPRVP